MHRFLAKPWVFEIARERWKSIKKTKWSSNGVQANDANDANDAMMQMCVRNSGLSSHVSAFFSASVSLCLGFCVLMWTSFVAQELICTKGGSWRRPSAATSACEACDGVRMRFMARAARVRDTFSLYFSLFLFALSWWPCQWSRLKSIAAGAVPAFE